MVKNKWFEMFEVRQIKSVKIRVCTFKFWAIIFLAKKDHQSCEIVVLFEVLLLLNHHTVRTM